ncbi:MAG TPA: type IX secretion system outer membrane channel protein PorV, partial [Bacteroidetes bacterium]|nr:type IX secretion system outer membrane channel protein PorV [Bacteroidota bacterium]
DLTGGFAHQGESAAKAGQSYAANISTYYETPIVVDRKDGELAFGLSLSNIGTKLSYNDDATKDFIPINLRLGGRFTLDMDEYNQISLLVDGNKLLVPTPPRYDDFDNPNLITSGLDPDVPVITGMLQSFYDAPGGFKEELREISYGVGFEYSYSGQFAVRGGYFDEHETKGNRKYFTIGAGVKYNVFKLDFAYLVPRAGQTNPLANTVRFTLGFDFEDSKGRRR